MIRAWFALLLLIFSIPALANLAPTDFVRDFDRLSNLERAAQSFEICDQLFDRWPQNNYEQEIQSIGQLFQAAPEAAYMLLSTCQTLWISRYLDPAKSTALTKTRNREKIAYYISALDFISSYKHLREEIRLFQTIQPKTSVQTPPSPYELLTGLASSESQLEETLHQEVKTAVTALAATGGTLITALKATKAFTDLTVSRSVQAGRIVKHAALVAIVAWGAGEIVEYKMWQTRQTELLAQVRALGKRIADPRNAAFAPVLMDEFYRATERLGYFYSYDLYLSESGADLKAHATNKKCHEQLSAFFGGAFVGFESSLFGAGCRDAAMVWIGAGQFLNRQLPNSPEARVVAERLLARAKRTYWRYEETRAHEKTLPVCSPDLSNSSIFKFNVECRDPVTGGLVI